MPIPMSCQTQSPCPFYEIQQYMCTRELILLYTLARYTHVHTIVYSMFANLNFIPTASRGRRYFLANAHSIASMYLN